MNSSIERQEGTSAGPSLPHETNLEEPTCHIETRLLLFNDLVSIFSNELLTVHDRLQHHRRRIEDRTDELRHALKLLRNANADLRPVGLRDRDAKKQEALGIKFKKPSQFSGDDRFRKFNVQKTDQTIRNKLEGLGILKEIFEQEIEFVEESFESCQKASAAIGSWENNQSEEANRLFLQTIENEIATNNLRLGQTTEMLEVLPYRY